MSLDDCPKTALDNEVDKIRNSINASNSLGKECFRFVSIIMVILVIVLLKRPKNKWGAPAREIINYLLDIIHFGQL